MSWTDERVELLKKLWADGLSASQIAAELGGITRNAVIGKVHRLGLSGRAKSASSAAPRPRKAAFGHAHAAHRTRRDPRQYRARARLRNRSRGDAGADREHHPDRPAAHHPGADRADLPLADRRSRQHRAFSSAAATPSTGLPYCAYHSPVAYQPASDRRRDRRPRLLAVLAGSRNRSDVTKCQSAFRAGNLSWPCRNDRRANSRRRARCGSDRRRGRG